MKNIYEKLLSEALKTEETWTPKESAVFLLVEACAMENKKRLYAEERLWAKEKEVAYLIAELQKTIRSLDSLSASALGQQARDLQQRETDLAERTRQLDRDTQARRIELVVERERMLRESEATIKKALVDMSSEVTFYKMRHEAAESANRKLESTIRDLERRLSRSDRKNSRYQNRSVSQWNAKQTIRKGV